MHNAADCRPDFVILGAPHPEGGVIVLASKELTQAELRTELNEDELFGGYGYDRRIGSVLRDYRTTLSTELRGYTMVLADTYGQAMANLFEQWTPPEPAGRQSIGAAVRQLDGERLALEGGIE
ncbi:hypothetical protein [Nocardia sp. NPDC055049]